MQSKCKYIAHVAKSKGGPGCRTSVVFIQMNVFVSLKLVMKQALIICELNMSQSSGDKARHASRWVIESLNEGLSSNRGNKMKKFIENDAIYHENKPKAQTDPVGMEKA